MGASAKTVYRLTGLVTGGHLKPGTRICDIGETRLVGDGIAEAATTFLAEVAARGGPAAPAGHAIAAGSLLGDLLVLAGFGYTALDIYPGPRTVVFDLNAHEPGPALRGQFGMVLNFGTTEHVFNQVRSFETIHDLMTADGVCYHDLPLAGYINHALFRYDPQFFSVLIEANHYALVDRHITVGAPRPVPPELKAIGFTDTAVRDVGLECILRRTSAEAFRIPLEMHTDSHTLKDVAESDEVKFPAGTQVNYGAVVSLHNVPFRTLTKHWLWRLRLIAARKWMARG